ncbi:hypothetical protein ACEE08_10705 [Staphylococcus rostri]
MEFNKYQSLKQSTDQQTHVLGLVKAVGDIAECVNEKWEDIDYLTVMLGNVLEQVAGIATVNNIMLDTVAGINVNSYKNQLNRLIDVGDTVTYNEQTFVVHDVIGNQVLIVNEDSDLVVDINRVSV